MVEEVEESVEVDKVVEEVIKVSVVPHLTVLAGLQCAANGVTVRPQTSPMETRMLASAPHHQTAPPGRQHAPNLDIAELMEEAEEEVEEVGVEEEEAVEPHVEAGEDLVEEEVEEVQVEVGEDLEEV